MRLFIRWLRGLWSPSYCPRCESCGDEGCGCWTSCDGGLFCKYRREVREYRLGASDPALGLPPDVTDTAALREDWEAVGRDLAAATEVVRRELGLPR